jgi:shikimate kinase
MVGMMGAGKTAVGAELARMLSVRFLDSDAEIERAAAASIAEIFARDGEPFFRAREAQVIARLLNGPPAVLSVGGGAFLNPATRTLIADLGVALWLKADLDLLWNRVRRKDTRPLLRTPDPRRTLAELMEAREPAYAQAQLLVEVAPEASVEQTAAQVLDALATRPDVFAPA